MKANARNFYDRYTCIKFRKRVLRVVSAVGNMRHRKTRNDHFRPASIASWSTTGH